MIPGNFSQEKQTLLKALGAEIINTPRECGMLGAEEKASELLSSIPGAISLEQFHNMANPQAHYETTGREIWEDLGESLAFFVAGAGSGGTYSGTMRFLKEKKPCIHGVLADPVGSTMGGGEDGEYDIEGIGNDFIADTMDIPVIQTLSLSTHFRSFIPEKLLFSVAVRPDSPQSSDALPGSALTCKALCRPLSRISPDNH